jgi:hypothetical protein
MDYLLFAEDPPIIEKIPKYYKKKQKKCFVCVKTLPIRLKGGPELTKYESR